MGQAVQSNLLAQIESVARVLPAGSQEDFRNLMLGVVDNLTTLSPGGNLLQPGGAQAGASAPPDGVVFNVRGGNGAFTVSIADVNKVRPGAIWHEVSYGPLVSFTQGVTTLPVTQSTTLTVPGPGVSAFFRLRVSFDRKTWSAYQLASTTAIDAGLVESGAMAPAATFNQTNYGVVNSQASGAAAVVTISGTGGLFTSYPAVKGPLQVERPSATIVGVEPASEQFVAWDGSGFLLKPTLASVFANDLEPVGKVSVVSTATPTLPVITPIIAGGGIVGFDVVSGGNGASEPYTLTIADMGGGTGATAGTQTIVAGVLISILPGNAGHSYTGATTVTPSGGAGGGGTIGGGTASGGNGGRLTAV